MNDVVAYWYNFAIMFEAVFILTAIDAGTRVGHFFLQEMLGGVIPSFKNKNWLPGIIISSGLFTFAWDTSCLREMSAVYGLYLESVISSWRPVASSFVLRC